MIPLDLREAFSGQIKIVESVKTSNHAAAKVAATSRRAELLADFEQKRRERNLERVDRVTPGAAQALAQRIGSKLLAMGDNLRDDPQGARLLLDALRPFRATKLRIGAPAATPAPSPEASPAGPLDGLTEELAAELAEVNKDMDAHAATLMARRQLAAVPPLAQAEARALGWSFDENTPGARETLLDVLKVYRKSFHDITQRDSGAVISEPATVERLRQLLRRAGVQGPEILASVGKDVAGFLAINRGLPLWAAVALVGGYWQVSEVTCRSSEFSPLLEMGV